MIACYLILRAFHFGVLMVNQNINTEIVVLIHNMSNNVYGPLLFLITIYSLNRTRKLSAFIFLLIFSPLLYVVFLSVFLSNSTIYSFLEVTTNLIYAIFSTISVIMILSYRRSVPQFKPPGTGFGHFLSLLLFLLIFSLVQVAGYYIFNTTGLLNVTLSKILALTYFISILIFVNGLIYLGLRYPESLSNISYLKKRIRSLSEGKYAYSNLRQPEAQQIIEKVKVYLKSGHRYKSHSITLEKVSHAISEFPQDVSQSLNQYLSKNFREFVNDFRLLEAARLLREKSEDHLIIKEIMYEVGFNSKSTFNTLFKNKFGCTPRKYRDNRE